MEITHFRDSLLARERTSNQEKSDTFHTCTQNRRSTSTDEALVYHAPHNTVFESRQVRHC